MTTIDLRIAARRHTVREASARHRLRHIIVAVGFAVTVGLVASLLQSPFMAVRDIDVVGAQRADVADVLQATEVVPGVPTISVRPGEVAALIESDPWVARANASVRWPGSVTITVLEHEPVGWIKVDGSWYRASGTGELLERSIPRGKAARIDVGAKGAELGETLKGKRAVAALEFVAVLPKQLRKATVVERGGDGTLIATVRGRLVNLGNPDDMAEKAATLTAIFEQDLHRKAVISVVSPARPAIRNPRPPVEG